MQQSYQIETMAMIHDMVHKEQKTIEQIAHYLCAYPNRIQDIYNQAVNDKTKNNK